MEPDKMEPVLEEIAPEVSALETEAVEIAEKAEETVDVTERLAEDFLTLAEEFPQFVRPNQLPEGVLDMAAKQGISLLDAYLRHRWQEEKKIAAAAEKRQQAAAQSAGNLSRGAVETPPEQDAFLRAFRRAL